MSAKVFVDSNIFIYTLDKAEEKRREKAKHCLSELSKSSKIFISTQVLSEVYVIALKKLRIDPLEIRPFISDLSKLNVLTIKPETVSKAIECSIFNKIGYWDALLLATASVAKCDTFWTEDLNEGQKYFGIKVANPLTKAL